MGVCRKNNEEDVKEVFINHPDMVLKLDDFSSIKINWEDKVSNIVEIAKELNIGLDSCVFIDDNPVEREIVIQMLPNVAVPTLSDDPSEYINDIERHSYFELIEFTDEAKKRSEYYKKEKEHVKLKNDCGSLESYYDSLGMIAEIRSFDLFNLPRITQLINKTNQFNLTTRRYNENEVKKFIEDDRWFTFYLKLKDRFGEYGLVGLMMCLLDGRQVFIDSWLMSCRVMGRTVENTMLYYLFSWAKENGYQIVHGKYIPTQKNKVVEDLYKKMGFNQGSHNMKDGTDWYCDLQINSFEENPFIVLVQ